MAKKIYKTLKVFDGHDMPAVIEKEFFDRYNEAGNDCYIAIPVERIYDPVCMWLVENGAILGETVLVKHAW